MKRCLATQVNIKESEEDEVLSPGCKERTATVVEVEKKVGSEGDNWLTNFMEERNEGFLKPPTPPHAQVNTFRTVGEITAIKQVSY